MQTESTKQDKGLVAAKGHSARGTFTTCGCAPNNTAVALIVETVEDTRQNRNVLIVGNSTYSLSKWTKDQ